jgi:hypothetical protein
MTREQMINHLKTNEDTIVVFEKKDGTERSMRCTLMESLLPEYEMTAQKPSHRRSTSTISVWDLDNHGWRSFRVDSVISFGNTMKGEHNSTPAQESSSDWTKEDRE